MRYVIVSVVKGDAGNFNNNMRKDVYEKFKAKSSKLPAHFTIKAPFDYDDISELERTLDKFSKKHEKAPYIIRGYNHFDNRVIYMDVIMSSQGKKLHDKLIDSLSNIHYVDFSKKDGKDKIFHITISSKKIQKIYDELWNYVNQFPCNYNCYFDNISIYKWQDNTWILHREYLLK